MAASKSDFSRMKQCRDAGIMDPMDAAEFDQLSSTLEVMSPNEESRWKALVETYRGLVHGDRITVGGEEATVLSVDPQCVRYRFDDGRVQKSDKRRFLQEAPEGAVAVGEPESQLPESETTSEVKTKSPAKPKTQKGR